MFAPGPRACVSGSWEMIQAKDLDYLGRRIIKKAMIKKKKRKKEKESYDHHPYFTGSQDGIARTEAEIAM